MIPSNAANAPCRRRSGLAKGTAVICTLAALIGGGLVYLAVDYELKRPTAGPTREFTMPDGSILTLRKVTFGKQHQLDVERPGPRFSFLAGTRRSTSQFTSNDSIVIWLSRRDAVTRRALDFDWWSHSVAVDDHGCEFVDEQPGRDAVSTHGSTGLSGSRPFDPLKAQSSERYNEIVAHSVLRPFRHDADTFKLRVFDLEGTTVAEFDVLDPSPTRGKFPVWEPESLPATKSDGDLSVTLKKLAGTKGERYVGSSNKAETIRLNPDFEVTQNGQPAAEWTRRNVAVFDALGNSGSTWDSHFCPRESAWKVQVRVFRGLTARFDPTELWSVSDVAVPSAGTVASLSQSQSLQGVTLELLAVGGSGTVTHMGLAPNNSVSWGHSGSVSIDTKNYPMSIDTEGRSIAGGSTKVQCELPHVVARVTGMTEDHYPPDLRVTDNLGRAIKTSSPTSHAGQTQFWFLEVPSDSTTLDLTFIVQKGRKVEFLVKPPAVEPLKGVRIDPTSPAAIAQRVARLRRQIDELRGTLRSNPENASASNELAWIYATAPDELRDARTAVELAEKAVALESDDASYQNTLAVAYTRAGDHDKAVSAAPRPAADDADWPMTLGGYALAISQSKLGDSTNAAETYSRALRRHKEQEVTLNPQAAHELRAARTDAMTELLGAPPAEVFTRGHQLARAGSWEAAAAEFDRALKIYPDEHWQWYRGVCLKLQLGDLDAYRGYCRTMLQLFGDTEDGYIAERTAKVCLLVPDALAGDPRPATLATKAVEVNPNFVWFLLVKGIAEFRAGEFQEAVNWLDKAKQAESNSAYSRALSESFLAMARLRLGKRDEARRSLDAAVQIIDQELPKPGSPNLGDSWHDWLMCHIVRREAESVVAGDSPSSR